MISRVLFPFRGAEIGGTHVATFALAGALVRTHELACEVICPDETLIMRETRRLGLRAIASGEAPTGRNNVLSDYGRVAARLRLLKDEGVGSDCILHCNDINSLRAWGLASRLAGATVIYHHHALNRLWWPPHLASLSWANGVIAVSDCTLAAARVIRHNAQKELNPFELNPDYDKAAARHALIEEFDWPLNARIVGWIGNFWTRKRPQIFLEAAKALARQDDRCRFVLFGRNGDYTIDHIRERAAALGLGGLAAVPGFRPSAEANLASLDLLLAPAPNEPFGRALVEAIVLGVPVVATAGAGHTEIINTWGGGRLISADATPEEIANRCIPVLDNAAGVRLPCARRREIAAQLSPVSHAARMLSLYENARKSRHSGQSPALARL